MTVKNFHDTKIRPEDFMALAKLIDLELQWQNRFDFDFTTKY